MEDKENATYVYLDHLVDSLEVKLCDTFLHELNAPPVTVYQSVLECASTSTCLMKRFLSPKTVLRSPIFPYKLYLHVETFIGQSLLLSDSNRSDVRDRLVVLAASVNVAQVAEYIFRKLLCHGSLDAKLVAPAKGVHHHLLGEFHIQVTSDAISMWLQCTPCSRTAHGGTS